MDLEDMAGFACGSLVLAFVAICLFFASAAFWDGFAEMRSRTAIYTCESSNLEPVRKAFTTQVTCRPRRLGADTLNLKTVP